AIRSRSQSLPSSFRRRLRADLSAGEDLRRSGPRFETKRSQVRRDPRSGSADRMGKRNRSDDLPGFPSAERSRLLSPQLAHGGVHRPVDQHRSSGSTYTRFLMWLDGGLGYVAVPRSFRLMLKMRRARARETIDKILSWEFDRLSLAHGQIVERGAKEIVRDAWSFL